MTHTARAEVSYDLLIKCGSDALAKFVCRMTLRNAGIPIGPWSTDSVLRGSLEWWDEVDRRVFVWRDDAPIAITEAAS